MNTSLNLKNANAVPLGNGILLFCPAATSVANVITNGGFRHFQSIEAFEIQTELNVSPVEVSSGGNRTLGRYAQGRRDLMYGINHDELNNLTTRALIGGGTPGRTSQSALSSASLDALTFATTAAVIGNWYQLMNSGVPVRNLTSVTISMKTEGVDFEVDLENGLIRFLTAQSANLTPVATAAAITSGSNNSFFQYTPLSEGVIKGVACLYIFDTTSGDVVYRHENFLTELRPNGSKTINQQQSPIQLLAPVLADLVGTVELSDNAAATSQ